LAGLFTAAWPKAIFGVLNVEDSIKLGYRSGLIAIEDSDETLSASKEKETRLITERVH
jgi:acetyl-CoA carboxylase carboxyltransferase component